MNLSKAPAALRRPVCPECAKRAAEWRSYEERSLRLLNGGGLPGDWLPVKFPSLNRAACVPGCPNEFQKLH